MSFLSFYISENADTFYALVPTLHAPQYALSTRLCIDSIVQTHTDRVNGVCWIACKYYEVPGKARNFSTVSIILRYGMVVIFRLCQLGKPSAKPRSRQITGILSNTYKPHSSKTGFWVSKEWVSCSRPCSPWNKFGGSGGINGWYPLPPPSELGLQDIWNGTSWSRHAIAENDNDSFRDSNLLHKFHSMLSGIKLFWCWYLTQHRGKLGNGEHLSLEAYKYKRYNIFVLIIMQHKEHVKFYPETHFYWHNFSR